ncbi:hypothetical protein JHD50_00470 [Sulfurimonas sp. MAG313]|nr:hypothetical protein [Sulfurimonas sp. MAG313]MDF1879787.1 hypothetical protein [Sulfurimonas sp. MAG313]
MQECTWVSAINTKNQLGVLLSLVESGALEELFIAQCLDSEVAGTSWKVGQIIVFAFSQGVGIKSELDAISETWDLDKIQDSYFEEIDGTHALKNVLFPESDAQEEQIIAQLR